SNAAKKEGFKQEKRLAKKERAVAIDKRFEEKRLKKSGVHSPEPEPEQRTPKTGFKKADVKNQSFNKHKKPEADPAPHQPAAAKQETGKKIRAPKPGSLEEKKLLAGMHPNSGQPALKTTKPSDRIDPADNKPARPGQHGAQRPEDNKPQAKDHGFKAKSSDVMPLNKYVAHSGICSRRDAADMIRKGEIRVNDIVVTEPGTKVSPKDTITIKGKKITPSKNLVYILLNKPKDYITTLDDPEGRKTVLDLIKRATDERVYPVGRLDRNTSGVLLITNDGELAQTLSHPSNLIKKIYEVRLDKQLTKADFDKLLQGIELEDGFIMPDALGYTDPKDKTIIGIEIHSGRNRIVRRIFEKLGYDVRNLDRVTYAGLTKKNVQRGKWRMLTEKEVRILRHFNPQTKKDKVKKEEAVPVSSGPKKITKR
ncbi:MAG: pseudouridine synthase, partial [Bacteroidota bacterium]